MPDFHSAPVLLRISMVGLFLAVAAPFAGPARCQGNQRALDALGPATASNRPAHGHPAHRHGRAVHHRAPVAATVAVPPTIPAAPPPPPAIKAPPIHVPLHPEPPPPPVPVVATAVGAVSDIQGGSRITFGSGSADLNPTAMRALQAFTAQMKGDPEARAQIDAYGSGTSDDPSTPRRMSLARGLAARAVLINGGIASTRIYVRAIGQPGDGSPADRIDVTRSDPLSNPPSPAPDQPDGTPGKPATTAGAPPTTGTPPTAGTPTTP